MPTPQEVRNYLDDLAARKKLITYCDLSRQFGFGAMVPELPVAMSKIFDQLDREDAGTNSPFITSVVVSRENGKPGSGYFNALRKYKGIDVSDTDKAWIAEIIALRQLFMPRGAPAP